MCTMLDSRNSALSLRRMSDALHLPHSIDMPTENIGADDTTPRPIEERSPIRPEGKGNFFELQGVRHLAGERPRVSVQDIVGTYQVLKSGIEIDIVDPPADWPSTLLAFQQRQSYPSSSSTSSPSSSGPSNNLSNDNLPPHVLEVISALQKENLLIRSELNFELWLKRENVKRTSRLYTDKIMVKGAEVERQGLVSRSPLSNDQSINISFTAQQASRIQRSGASLE